MAGVQRRLFIRSHVKLRKEHREFVGGRQVGVQWSAENPNPLFGFLADAFDDVEQYDGRGLRKSSRVGRVAP